MDLRKITTDAVREAALIEDLDAAVLSLQTPAGIEDGGVAGLVLSYEDWEGADQDSRVIQLTRWFLAEAAHAPDHPPIRYVLRDIQDKGVNYLLWGDGDPEAARISFEDAISQDLEVELAFLDPEKMDDLTQGLVEGFDDKRDSYDQHLDED